MNCDRIKELADQLWNHIFEILDNEIEEMRNYNYG